ncbi:Protein-glutamine gamma-glutamyltransferase [Pseudoclavibacter triregionum]|nr:Protein-glutamine gamma-glutamyltransferase [Pseudoclavibacter triregionum]
MSPARRSVAEDLEARGSWLVAASSAAVILAALAVIRPVFSGDGWLSPAVILVAAILIAATLVRTLVAHAGLAILAGALAGLGVIAWAMHPPSLAALPGLLDQRIVEAFTQLASDTPPIRDTPGVTLVLLILIALVTVLVDVLALGAGMGATALAPVVLLLAIPFLAEIGVATSPIEAWPLAVLAVAVAFHLLTTALWRRRIADAALADEGFLVDERGFAGIGGATAITAAALAAAIAATAILPPPQGLELFTRDGPASLATNRANPIVDLGEDLRRPTPVEAFQYATTVTSGRLPYFELVTLTSIDDASSEWAPGDFAGDTPVLEGVELPPAQGAEGAQPMQMTVGIVTHRGTSAYLPIPGEARLVNGLQGDYNLDPATGDIRQVEGDAPGQQLEITSDVPLLDPSPLASATADGIPDELAPLEAVPSGAAADAIRSRIMAHATGATPYAQALSIRSWLADSGEFAYSLTAPVAQGYDGTNLDVVAQFLDAKSGYCVHFASTMAIAARMLGLPSRIVVGFTPGSPVGVNGDGQQLYSVSSGDLHSWAEIYAPGVGWTPFEATPSAGVGSVAAVDPSATVAQTVEATPTENPTPTPTEQPADPTPGQSGGGGSETTTATPTIEADQDGDEAAGLDWGPILAIAGAVLGGLALLSLLLGAPAITRALRRRARLAIAAGERVDEDQLPGLAAWRELRDEAEDLGAGRLDHGTPASVESRLVQALGEDPDEELLAAVGRVRAVHEASAFDRPERRAEGAGPELREDVEAIERGLREAAGPKGRRRARLWPRSVVDTARRGRR